MTQSTTKLILILAVIIILIISGRFLWSLQNHPNETYDPDTGSGRIAVTFSGGYETESVDHGRPVKLIAGALNVPSKVFREAFSHVNPAPAGGHPSHERVRENKNVLMKALGPHGITNDRLDEVSNYYRYNRSRGEMWHVKQATAYAIVKEGMITHIEVTHGGSGYNSPPSASIPNFPSIKPVVQLSFDRQFEKNGSVKLIDVK